MADSESEKLFGPTPGLSYSPSDPHYYEAAGLRAELDRSFDLCHSCRLCFKYCQSFPTLFSAVDANDGLATGLPAAVTRQVVDECFGCRLCYVHCPYTPQEGHEFQLDFPALMLRARAQRVRAEGVPRREKLLSNPDKVGRQGTLLPVLANAVNKNSLMRSLMERAFGIHRQKQLPQFHKPTFEGWFHGRPRAPASQGNRKVALFFTCFVNYNAPDIGRAAVEVLEHNGAQVKCPAVNCCGMPALDCGDIDFARAQAKKNVQELLPLVEQGCRVAVINPTCGLMLKREYPVLLDARDDPALAAAAKKVSTATRDICELLAEDKAAGHFQEDYQSTPGGTIAYHVPCHLKAQAIGYKARDLMRKIPNVKVKLVDRCSGHDGTWAMKKEYFELSMKNGQAAFEEMQAADASLWASDCPLAAMQFEQATGKRPWHPVQVIAAAYKSDGFGAAHPSAAAPMAPMAPAATAPPSTALPPED